MTQNNLGSALSRLGERESSTLRLEEAVTAYREVLKEYIRDKVPFDWAMTQNNLGNALSSLGERESSTLRLEEAVTAYSDALKKFIQANTSYYIEVCDRNLKKIREEIVRRKK
jgi:tetratricopeptide (TPR) repeat protein